MLGIKMLPWLGLAAAIAIGGAFIAGHSKGKESERLRCEAAAQRAKIEAQAIDKQVREELEAENEKLLTELQADKQKTDAENEKLRQELANDKCVVEPGDVDRL